MSKPHNKLLQRQIRKYLKGTDPTPEMERFFRAVSESYDHMERDESLMKRAMERSSDELIAKNQELQAKNDTLDGFVYRVSHDLKMPANNLISMAKMLREVLREDEASAQVLQILDYLEKAGNTMRTRILDLLEMTRVEHQMHAAPEPLDLHALTTGIVASLEQQIQDSEGTVELDFSEVPTILFGRENMASILINLIGNALKYQHPDRSPYIQAKSWRDKTEFCISVEDNGLGMDLNKNGERLFNMFARLHNHVEGTGIGLYIVKKIIDNANGSINVESKLNEGTRFTIRFPGELIPNTPELHPADR